MLLVAESYSLITRGSVIAGPSGAGSSVKRRHHGSKPGTGPTSTASATGSSHPARQSQGRIQTMRKVIPRALLAAAAAGVTVGSLGFTAAGAANATVTG